jgi:hypothetical protein
MTRVHLGEGDFPLLDVSLPVEQTVHGGGPPLKSISSNTNLCPPRVPFSTHLAVPVLRHWVAPDHVVYRIDLRRRGGVVWKAHLYRLMESCFAMLDLDLAVRDDCETVVQEAIGIRLQNLAKAAFAPDLAGRLIH